MPTRAWFPTHIYCEPLRRSRLDRFNAELAEECRRLRDFDAAGRRWSARNYPGGYTSYASMNELHRFSSTFAELERKLARHTRAFARTLDFDLRGRTVDDGPAAAGQPLFQFQRREVDGDAIRRRVGQTAHQGHGVERRGRAIHTDENLHGPVSAGW